MIPPSVLDPARVRAILQGASADLGWRILEVRSVSMVKERPGQRRTYRYELMAQRVDDPPRKVVWYGKEYMAGPGGARVCQALRFLRVAAPPQVRVPEPLGYSPPSRLLVTTALEGPTLGEVLGRFSQNEVTAVLTTIGGALARFHALKPGACSNGSSLFDHRDASTERLALEQARERIASSPARSSLQGRFDAVSALLREILARQAHAPSEPSLIHGDLRPEKILVQRDGMGLLGIDEIACGEPELDLGTLEAHLVAADRRRGKASAGARVESLGTGYQVIGGIDPGRVETYAAATLLDLASREAASPAGEAGSEGAGLASALIAEAERRAEAARVVVAT